MEWIVKFESLIKPIDEKTIGLLDKIVQEEIPTNKILEILDEILVFLDKSNNLISERRKFLRLSIAS